MITIDEAENTGTLHQNFYQNPMFANNTLLVRFPEFKYFKNIKWSNKEFSGCINLEYIELPEIEKLGDDFFNTCEKIKSVYVKEGTKVLGLRVCGHCKTLQLIDLPSTIETIYQGLIIGISNKQVNIIIRALTPPRLEQFYTAPKAIYVPDNSVELYKTATGDWSKYVNYIKPLSEYVE